MNATEPRIEISEQTDANGATIYHWTIYTAEGNEFSHSAYHTDRTRCEVEAKDRLDYAVSQGWL